MAMVSSTSETTSRIAERCRHPRWAAAGRDLLQQLHVREPQDPLLAGDLHDDVETRQACDHQQEQEEPRVWKPVSVIRPSNSNVI